MQRGFGEFQLDISNLGTGTVSVLAVYKVVQPIVQRICHPAAEEFGGWLRDRMAIYRAQNLQEVLLAAEKRLPEGANVHAHPRIAYQVFEAGSLESDKQLQEWWGGLLASSCTENGDDDSNLMFSNILKQLTATEAKLVKFVCENCVKSSRPVLGPNMGVECMPDFIDQSELIRIAGTTDKDRLARELLHLESLGLMYPMSYMSEKICVRTTTLCLDLYVRCQGSRQSAKEFFKIG